MIVDLLNYTFTAIMMGICVAWIFLIKSMMVSFRETPYLEKFAKKPHSNPKVSIILPARNEEDFLAKCLDTLVDQDYPNYEIIVIDDSSQDNTRKIIERYASKYSKIIPVFAKPKPDGWMGKNWACVEGFKKSSGDLLLFTDADTKHAKNVITLAVGQVETHNLEALTVIPRMITLDFWTNITLPMISTFLHTRFSAIRVNDPSKKTGYFFGSFFIINRETYQKVGTHEGVKQEIIEDGALGKKVKENGHRMKMVRGEKLIGAIWARDKGTLWNALKRLMIPLTLQSQKIAIGIFFAVLFLLFIPFPILVLSSFFVQDGQSYSSLFFSSMAASIFVYLGGIIEVKKGLDLKLVYAIFAPLGSLVVVLAFLSGLIQAKMNLAISWRGRSYSMKDHVQDSIRI